MPKMSAACSANSISASQSCWRSDSRKRNAREGVGSALMTRSVRRGSPAMSKVLAIAQFTLLEAVRTRLLWLVLAALGGLLLASLFVQQLAIAESARVQTGFLAAGARLAVVFVLCLHVASSMAREFNDKGVELLLSLDLPRAGYYLGKLSGYVALALVVAIATTATLAVPSLITKALALVGLSLRGSPLRPSCRCGGSRWPASCCWSPV